MTMLSTATTGFVRTLITRCLKASAAAAIGMVFGLTSAHAQTKLADRSALTDRSSLTASSTALAISANKYTATLLPLDGAYDMNPDGLIVGMADGLPAVYVNGSVRYLDVPRGYTEVVANAVSTDGRIVGYGKSGKDTRGIYWRSYIDPAKDMGAMSNYTMPLAVNQRGIVVGYFKSSDRQLPHAFRWSEATGYKDLNPTGYIVSTAYAISRSGYIAGYSTYGQNEFYASRWYPTEVHGSIARGTGMRVFDDGRVLGTGFQGNSSTQISVIWDLSNTQTPVGPNPVTHTVADINANNRMVGTNTSGQAWTTLNNSAVTYLPVPAGKSGFASRVSTCGAILGGYVTGIGTSQPILWTRMTCDQSTAGKLAP